MRTGMAPAGPGMVESVMLASSTGLGRAALVAARSSSAVLPSNEKPVSAMKSRTVWACGCTGTIPPWVVAAVRDRHSGTAHRGSDDAHATMAGMADDRLPTDLAAMLAAYTVEIETLARAAIERMDRLVPGAERLVYDNYNATVVSYSPDGNSGRSMCSVATYPRWVNLFVVDDGTLPDPGGILQGSGSRYRHIRLREIAEFDERVEQVILAAVDGSDPPYGSGPATWGEVSVATTRRPRRPA